MISAVPLHLGQVALIVRTPVPLQISHLAISPLLLAHGFASGVLATIIYRSVHNHCCNQCSIGEARLNAFIHRGQAWPVSRDNRGEASVVAVIEKLEQFLAGPW